jgi:Uma2 family endonuclease
MTIVLEHPATESPTPNPKPLSTSSQRYDATWADYVEVRDNPELDCTNISFYDGWLFVDMGLEGPAHSSFSDLMTMIFGFWVLANPDAVLQSYGRCILELPDTHACGPDLVLYKGDNIPRWKVGEPRRILFNRDRVPDLVGEISDTSLSIDLDEQKRLYASLGIAEYWVIDVKGKQIFAFGLTENKVYKTIEVSQVLTGLPIALIEQTLERLETETNTAAASWLMLQLQNRLQNRS